MWTAHRAAKAGLIDSGCGNTCPSCGESIREDIPHILLECSFGADARHALIQPVVDRVVEQSPALPTREELAVLILGGQVGEMSLSPWWLEGTAHDGVGSLPGFVLVAEFLQKVMPGRMAKLWSLRDPQPAEETLGSYPQPDKRVEAQDGYDRPTSGRAR